MSQTNQNISTLPLFLSLSDYTEERKVPAERSALSYYSDHLKLMQLLNGSKHGAAALDG